MKSENLDDPLLGVKFWNSMFQILEIKSQDVNGNWLGEWSESGGGLGFKDKSLSFERKVFVFPKETILGKLKVCQF